MKHVYFVSWTGKRKGEETIACGNGDVVLGAPITDLGHVRQAEEYIRGNQGLEWVFINNFILLRTEPG